MGMMLPTPLVWVLDMVGVSWPDIDEDDLRQGADELRQVADELTGHTGEAKTSIEKMLGENSSQSLDLFEGMWTELADDHLPQFATTMEAVATGLDISAGLVVGLKVGAIAQLALLAAEIIADQAAAPFTFGLSEAAIPAEIAATRVIMKTLVKKAVGAVEDQVMNQVQGAAVDALTGSAEQLAGQLVGNAVSGESVVDLGAAAKAGLDATPAGAAQE